MWGASGGAVLDLTGIAGTWEFCVSGGAIPNGIAKGVAALAQARKTSANRVLVDLIEAGLQSKEAEKERFLLLVKRLTESPDSAERERLKEELARMTFGD